MAGELLYFPGLNDNIEYREYYAIGGFHPVLIGDVMKDGRYRVVHKLGFGSFGTVWLARDFELARYVALKILTAVASKVCQELAIQQYLQSLNDDHSSRRHISSFIDDFTLNGPNGQHLCLVYETLGPSIASLRSEYAEAHLKIRPDIARELVGQVGEALGFLHKNGLICSDLSASNILIELSSIHGLLENELYEQFGAPEEDEMQLSEGEVPLSPSAPRVVYAPIDWSKVPLQYLAPRIKLIDFGNTFMKSSPVADSEIGFNNAYAAPELLTGSRPTAASDLWGFACVLFDIRAGKQLFGGYFGTKEEVAQDIKAALGPSPADQKEPRAAEHYREEQSEPSEVNCTSQGVDVAVDVIAEPSRGAAGPDAWDTTGRSHRRRSSHTSLTDICWTPIRWVQRYLKKSPASRSDGGTAAGGPWKCRDSKSRDRTTGLPAFTHDVLADRILRRRILNIGKPEQLQNNGPQEGTFPKPLTEEEAADFEDLLAGILKYDPAERMTLDQILTHRWFSRKYAPHMGEDWLERCD